MDADMEKMVREWIGFAFFGGIGLFIIRKWITDLSEKCERFVEKQNECRETLPYKYADKNETKESFKRIWSRVDRNTERIGRIEGRMNGAK